MIYKSSIDNCLWVNEPKRIAQEIYPDSGFPDDMSPITDAELALSSIHLDLVSLEEERLNFPVHMFPDQLEDWLVARAVKYVIKAREEVARG